MKPDHVIIVAHSGRSPMCDCGTCCDACGHDSNCMSRPENQS